MALRVVLKGDGPHKQLQILSVGWSSSGVE